jgi:uncharacterized membrane protein (UPF0127 family)
MISGKKTLLFLSLILLIIIFSFIFYFVSKKDYQREPAKFVRIIFNDKVEVRAEVFQTLAEKTKGLSGRQELLPNEGALFIYQEPGFYHFWMKEMNFPIDIIWLLPEENKKEVFKIVDITPTVSPDSFPQTFSSRVPSQYVLEVKAGFAKENDLKINSFVKIKGL